MIPAHVPVQIWTEGGGVLEFEARLTSVDPFGDRIYTLKAPPGLDGVEFPEPLPLNAHLEIEWPS